MLSGNGRGCAGLACGVTAEYSGSCHFSSRPREKSRPSLARCPANLRRRQIVSGSAWNSSEPPVRLTTVHHHGTRARPKESVRGAQNWCFAALCHVRPLWRVPHVRAATSLTFVCELPSQIAPRRANPREISRQGRRRTIPERAYPAAQPRAGHGGAQAEVKRAETRTYLKIACRCRYAIQVE